MATKKEGPRESPRRTILDLAQQLDDEAGAWSGVRVSRAGHAGQVGRLVATLPPDGATLRDLEGAFLREGRGGDFTVQLVADEGRTLGPAARLSLEAPQRPASFPGAFPGHAPAASPAGGIDLTAVIVAGMGMMQTVMGAMATQNNRPQSSLDDIIKARMAGVLDGGERKSGTTEVVETVRALRDLGLLNDNNQADPDTAIALIDAGKEAVMALRAGPSPKGKEPSPRAVLDTAVAISMWAAARGRAPQLSIAQLESLLGEAPSGYMMRNRKVLVEAMAELSEDDRKALQEHLGPLLAS